MTELELMKEAIEESRESADEDGRNHPRVGAIIVNNGEIIARAHRGEIAGSHAEYIALRKIEDVQLDNATVYTTLEPCTSRNHPKISCAERLVLRKVGHVVIGMLDPNPLISGKGVRFLRRSGVKVSFFPHELMQEVEEINKEFDSQFEPIKLAAEKQTIDSFQRHLNSIYSGINTKHTIEYTYSYLHRTTDFLLVKLSKNKADNDSDGQLKPVDFIRPLSWLVALATKLGCNLQNAFFSKYPNVCPYCLEDICQCYITEKRPKPKYAPYTRELRYPKQYQIAEDLKLKYESIKNHNTLGFDFAINVIASTYPLNKINWKDNGPSRHIIKTIEELGEVHEAISKYAKGQITPESRLFSEELADVLGWLISAWDIVFPTLSLDAELLNYYIKDCPICKASPCNCEEYSGINTTLVSTENVIHVKDGLIQLNKMLTAPILEELISSISVVEKTQSDPQVRLCFSEIAYQLEAIERSVKVADPAYKEILSIIHTILRIINPIIERDKISYFYNTLSSK